MRILLLNGFGHTANVGDHALLIGTIRVLRSALPLAKIYVVPWQQPTPGMRAAFRMLVGTFNDVELGEPILPAPFSAQGFPDAPWIEKMKTLGWTAWANVKAELDGRMADFSGPDSPARILRESDLIVLRGCNIVQRGKSLRALASVRRITFPLSLARRAKKPSVFMNVSVGPLEHPMARSMVKRALQGAAFLSTREKSTQEYLAKLTSRISVSSADTAFAFQDTSPNRTSRQPYLVGLNVLSRGEYLAAVGASVEAYYAVLGRIAAELNDLCRSLPALRVLAIPHEVDSSQLNSDVEALKFVIDRLDHPERVDLVSGAPSPGDVVQLYGRCGIAIGMRFHGYVLASLAGTPLLGIDVNSRKVTGVAETLGLREWMIDLSQAGQLVERATKALSMASVLHAALVGRVDSLRAQVFDTFAAYVQSSFATPASAGRAVGAA